MIYIVRTIPHSNPDAWDEWEINAPDPVAALAALWKELGPDVEGYECGRTRADFEITRQRLKSTAHTD